MSAVRFFPRRGEVWTAEIGQPPTRHWVVVISLDARNQSEHIDSLLVVPFGSRGFEGPTTLRLEPGESGLPGPSYLKGHFIQPIKKVALRERVKTLSNTRLRELVLAVRRAIDPDAPAWQSPPDKPGRAHLP